MTATKLPTLVVTKLSIEQAKSFNSVRKQAKLDFAEVIRLAVLETIEYREQTNKLGFLLEYFNRQQQDIIYALARHPGANNFKRQAIEVVEDFERLSEELLSDYLNS